jgi:phasin family protein
MTDFNNQALALTKSLADTTFKAHTLALESLERLTSLQFKAIESRVAATADFFTEAAEARDFDDLKTIWPKGVNLVKETAEKLYANSQEAFGITVKTGEALSQLAKGSFELASDNIKKQVSAATTEFTSKVNAAAKKTTK